METFIVEGRWAVEAILDSSYEVSSVSLEIGRHHDLVDVLERANVPYQIRSRTELEADRGYAFHRGVFAEALRPGPQVPSTEFLDQATRVAVPVGLADPGNLGTVIRSAVAFDADAIVIESSKGADYLNPKCVRASATAVFRVPVFEVTSLSTHIESWKSAGFVVFGTSLSERSVSIRDVEPAKRSVILLGSEEEGLSRELESLCDELVRIPMSIDMDSLNVGAGAAIAFWELWRDA